MKQRQGPLKADLELLSQEVREKGCGCYLDKKLIVCHCLVPFIIASICVVEALTALGVYVMVNVIFQEGSERWLLGVSKDDHFQSTMSI